MSDELNMYMKEYRKRPDVKAKIARYMREYRTRPEVKEKKRLYKKRLEVKDNLRTKRASNEERLRNHARNLVNRMISDGRLNRQPCEECNIRSAEAHHDDYSKPTKIRWLCHKHHSEFHNKVR